MTSIDLKRACTAASNRGCWLVNQLASWNELLNRYGLNLTEVEPGKLALSTFHYCHDRQYHLFCRDQHYTPAFFIDWLPKKHHCLRTLRLMSEVSRIPCPIFDGSAALIDSAGQSSNLQKLEVEGDAYFPEACAAIRASKGSLEDVSVSNWGDPINVPEELVAFVKESAHHLKKLSIRISFKDDKGMLKALLHCTELTDLTLHFPHKYSVPWPMSQLLKQCHKLEKLSLDSRDFSPACSTSLHEALRLHTSLTHLHVIVRTVADCHDVCDSMGYSSSLRTLQLSYLSSTPVCAETPIAALLAKNTGLTTLILCYFFLCRHHSASVADGLAGNSLLELLDIKKSTIDVEALSLLTGSLEKNTTLRKLKIGKPSTPFQGDALLRVLSTGEGRVELTPWTEDVVSTQAPNLTMQGVRPRELALDVSSRFSGETLRCLRAALKEARSVRRLTLHITDSIGPALGDAISYLLEDNHFITTVKVRMDDRSYHYSLLREGWPPGAVHFRPQWPLFAPPPRENWHSDALGKTGSAARYRIGNQNDCLCEGIFSLALSLTGSPTVTSFEVGGLCLDFSCFDVSKTVTRHLSLLNDAIRFVTRDDVGRQCALAFETLATAPSLRERLSKVTGKSEAACELAVRAATGFLADNFFIVTGVVERSLSCHPKEGLQVDFLNAVGVRLVTRHLRVSDVSDGTVRDSRATACQ